MMAAFQPNAAEAEAEVAPVICLAGPTAAGKSAATLALAERWPIEIVNVDSATIYRGMDIGTAKPSREERSRAPQHLLDICDPGESYSAAAFRRDALSLIAAIRARGRIPLLAGGTMLYFKALRDGIDELPGADPALRAALEQEAAEQGWPAMHAALARVDSVTAARLAPNDSQRIQRALEIYRSSGLSMSDWIAAAGQRRENGEMSPADQPVPVITISLEPTVRSALHARIAGRFDQMLEAGLVEEVRVLRDRGDLHPGLPSMRCVGYRQIWSHLEGEVDLATAREMGIAATRQLAKRQMTWLRALPERRAVDCLSSGAVAAVVAAFAACLAAS
jgi:tRNA dimethylallyltransferase